MNNKVDEQYFKLINYILENGVIKNDRTGTGTISIFDYTMKFNMNSGFPLLTSKKMFTKGVIHELIWFLKGDTNIKYLVDNDVHIWDGDAYKNYIKLNELSYDKLKSNPVLDIQPLDLLTKKEFINEIKSNDEFAKKWGELGPVYGKQWRNWNGVDQIKNLISDLKENPNSRRLIVSAWNIEDLNKMVLPPCHYSFQCYTIKLDFEERIKIWCDSINKSLYYADDFTDKILDDLNVPKFKLSLKWSQRSCDVPLGIPFNIASYGLLLHLIAKEVNMIPNELIFSGGDCHIYLNQIDVIKEQLKNETFDLPKIELSNKSIFNLKFDDIKIINYKSSDAIKIKLSN